MIISEKQYKTLAELYYRSVYNNSYGSWKDLVEEARDKYLAEIKVMIDCFEKVGLEVVPAGQGERPRREVEYTKMEIFIREFIKTKVQKPIGLVGIFPYQQLAHEIVKEFKI